MQRSMLIVQFTILLMSFHRISSNRADSDPSHIRCVYKYQFQLDYCCILSIFNLNGVEFEEIEGTFDRPLITHENIVDVNITNQKTATIPSILCNTFPNLKDLTIKSSGLTTLDPDSFVNCSKLIALRISKNKFPAIPNGTFKHLTKMVQLELNENKIEKISPENFIGAEMVVNLHLEGNLLTEIPPGTFDGLRDMMVLNISRNKIARLDSKSFGGSLACVVGLHAIGNVIRGIDPLIIEQGSSLRYFNLAGNKCIDSSVINPKNKTGLLSRCFDNYKRKI